MSVLDLFDLHGKRALVTGASSGIGKRVAMAYAAGRGPSGLDGAEFRSVADGRRRDRRSRAVRVVPISCDVTQPEQVSRMLDQVTAELGGIDIAVCNAGIITVTPMLDMSLEEFQSIQDTNVTGVFLTAQAAAKAMVAAGTGRGHHQHRLDVRPHHQHPAAGRPLLRLEGRGHSPDQGHGRGVGSAQDPGEQRQSGLYPHRARRALLRSTTRCGSRRFRWAGWAGPKNSPACTSTWPARPPAT